MAYRQTRIFAPYSSPFLDQWWAETIIGHIIKPLVTSGIHLNWFWFSRYVSPRSGDVGDCNINQIPEIYGIYPGNQNPQYSDLYRSIRFRYSVPNNFQDEFESQAMRFIEHAGVQYQISVIMISLVIWVALRFIENNVSQVRKEERANLVVDYLHSISKLIVDCIEVLHTTEGFSLEKSTSMENPNGSIFESLHHLLCNMTNVPIKRISVGNGNRNILVSPS
jgi:hypothetical protein